MATVTLFFSAFPGSNAIGLQIQESPDGVDDWVEILDTDQIGSYPNWVTSYTVEATSIDYWFRIRWQLQGSNIFTEWSAPVLGSALPFHWTVPDLWREVTVHPNVGWNNIQIQMLIDRSYHLIQNGCGPYDESDPEFAPVAQLVIHSVMDRMFPALSSLALGAASGMKSEVQGSYEYERFEGALGMSMSGFVVPSDLLGLICPFGAGSSAEVSLTTTSVFSQPDHWVEEGGVKVLVFTTLDRWRLAPNLDPFGVWWRWID